MATPKIRHEIGKIVLPKRKKVSRPLPARVRAMLDPSEEEYEPLPLDDETDEDQIDDEVELITFDYGQNEHNYAAAPMINFNDHSYCRSY